MGFCLWHAGGIMVVHVSANVTKHGEFSLVFTFHLLVF